MAASARIASPIIQQNQIFKIEMAYLIVMQYHVRKCGRNSCKDKSSKHYLLKDIANQEIKIKQVYELFVQSLLFKGWASIVLLHEEDCNRAQRKQGGKSYYQQPLHRNKKYLKNLPGKKKPYN